MMRTVVTGGAGFLGQYLVRELVNAGCRVTVLDLKPAAQQIVDLRPLCEAVCFGVDVTQPETLSGRFAGFDVVYHLAGVVSFWKKHAQLLFDVNTIGTRNVVEAVLRDGAARMIHISTVAAVGYGPDRTPIDESFSFDWSRVPHKHYMTSKHLAELEVLKGCERGLNAVIVNPGLMWGPGDLINSAKLIRNLRQGKIPACPPGGTNIVDVRDIARGLPAFRSGGRTGERFILGGSNLTFREVYDITAEVLKVPSPKRTLPRFTRSLLYYLTWINESLRSAPPPLTSDNVDSSFYHRYFSSVRAEREVGWQPRISFEQTMRDAVAWLQEKGLLDQP